jgi:multisubunit Na+/H+ antiporter MnhF subunit
MNEWLWAAAILTVALTALVIVAVLRPFIEGVIALEAASVDATLVMLLIAEGTRRQPFGDLALVLGTVSFAGTIAFLRFGRELDA